MWKESYRIGIKKIDEQHQQLFEMVDHLMKAIEGEAGKEVFEKSIHFLKEYVVYHFKEEEEYQESILYTEVEEHKKIHRDFTKTVLQYEKKLQESDFDIKVVKDLAGVLTAWLIYHVADTDQKIGKNLTTVKKKQEKSLEDDFSDSVCDVIYKMTGLNIKEKERKVTEMNENNILIEAEWSGDKSGYVIYGYSKEAAIELWKIMTGIEKEEVEEFVYSMLIELSNIISGNVAVKLSDRGIKCRVAPPAILQDKRKESQQHAVCFNTGIGKIIVFTVFE